jgi:hypothetical protein
LDLTNGHLDAGAERSQVRQALESTGRVVVKIASKPDFMRCADTLDEVVEAYVVS